MRKLGCKHYRISCKTTGFTSFLFCVIYFSSDILSRDRKYQAVLQGLPLSWYRQLNLKSLSAFLYSMIFILGIIVVGVLVMTIQFGFGYFDLNVPIMINQETFTPESYSVISMAAYLGKTLVVVPLLVILFVQVECRFKLAI